MDDPALPYTEAAEARAAEYLKHERNKARWRKNKKAQWERRGREIKAGAKVWLKANREHVLKRSKKYYEKHAKKNRAAKRAAYAANPEKYKARVAARKARVSASSMLSDEAFAPFVPLVVNDRRTDLPHPQQSK